MPSERKLRASASSIHTPILIQSGRWAKNGVSVDHRSAQSALTSLCPGRDDAGRASVGDELTHVLVGVNDDAQIHAVDGGVAIGDVHLAFEVLRRGRQIGQPTTR